MTKQNSASSNLQHHFATLEQQYESSQLGMWTFLVTEILFFGGLFAGYSVYRMLYPAAFAAASHHLDIFWGALNTAILLGSSFTMALAVHAGQEGKNKRIICFLAATILLGAVFLGIKGIEYAHKYHEHLIPGLAFRFPDYQGPGTELFFSFYFAMTGLHAVHMIIGVGLLLWVMLQAHKKQFSTGYSTPVEMVGLYWHFVDIVWIFLFPLLYLIGRH